MTCTTLPMFRAGGGAAVVAILSLECRGAADDLGNLLRDLRLTGAVICTAKHVENVAGVVGCVFHRGAPSSLLRCRGLDECAIHGVPDVQRQELRENRLG